MPRLDLLRPFPILVMLVAGGWWWPAAAWTAPKPEEIAAAIAQLGDDNFQTRENASRFLWQAGQAAEADLRQAATSPDLEVAVRAKRILKKFSLGIFPDTPPEVLELIAKFQAASPGNKESVLRQLQSRKQIRTVMALIRSERDSTLRERWRMRLLANSEPAVRHLLSAGEYQQAEELLELGAVGDRGIRNWAAYCRLRGTIKAQVDSLRAKLALDDKERVLTSLAHDREWTRLAYLLRAQGNPEGACDAVQKSANGILRGSLLIEAGRWKELSQLALDEESPGAEASRDNLFAGGSEISRLGWHAAFHRLAGNETALRRAIDRIERSSVDEANAHSAFEGLMFNDQFERGIELQKGRPYDMAFELLVFQQRFRESFEFAGVKRLGGDYTRWFEALIDDPGFKLPEKTKSGPGHHLFYRGAAVAEQLFKLGEVAASDRLYALLAKAAQDADPAYRLVLAKAQFKLGRRDQAMQLAADAVTTSNYGQWFRNGYRDAAGAAGALWQYRRTMDPFESRLKTLKTVDDWVRRPASEWDQEEFAALLRTAAKSLPDEKQSTRARRLAALAAFCRLRGNEALELELLERAAELESSQRMAYAEAFARQGNWEAAADQLAVRWQEDQADVGALWLWGEALRQCGEEAKGAEKQQLAILLPLANGAARHQLASTMKRLGHRDAANRQWELILQTDAFNSWHRGNAAQELGNAIAATQPSRAASLWEQMMLRVLQPSTSIVETAGFLDLPRVIHKTRGKGLLEEGHVDEALQQFELARSAGPGHIDLAIDMVPLLEQAGRAEEAEKLFARIYQVSDGVCRDFPNSAYHHNQTAWLAVRCRRGPDEALEHAQIAVRLKPDKAAYIDTLAEVHLVQGDRAKAMELIRRCIELEPENKLFQSRLEEFQQAAAPP